MVMTSPELKFPFARELQEQHDALRATVRWFQSEFDPGRLRGQRRSGAASGFLREFREELIRHFRFEEQAGDQAETGWRDPDIQPRMQELARQHGAFEERLESLQRRLEAAGPESAIALPLLRELGGFFADLGRHEAEERALLRRISRDTESP